MTLLSISIIASIPAIIGAVIAAVLTWKVQKYFIPKRDYYRKSAVDIFDMKFTPSLGAFLFFGYLIYAILTTKFGL